MEEKRKLVVKVEKLDPNLDENGSPMKEQRKLVVQLEKLDLNMINGKLKPNLHENDGSPTDFRNAGGKIICDGTNKDISNLIKIELLDVMTTDEAATDGKNVCTQIVKIYEKSLNTKNSILNVVKSEISICVDFSDSPNSTESRCEDKTDDVKPSINGFCVGENGEIYSADPFKINIPLIGKNVITDTSDGDLNKSYHLASEINNLRWSAIQEDSKVPTLSYEELRKQRNNRSAKEKVAEVKKIQQHHREIAAELLKISLKLLKLLQNDVINEKAICKIFRSFLNYAITPTSLLYTPHFVHAIMFCRANTLFSRQLRVLADECYQKCHCMFSIPPGYNFETVYTSEVSKFAPGSYKILAKHPLVYEDLSDSDSD